MGVRAKVAHRTTHIADSDDILSASRQIPLYISVLYSQIEELVGIVKHPGPEDQALVCAPKRGFANGDCRVPKVTKMS